MHVIFLYSLDECSLDGRGLRLGLPPGTRVRGVSAHTWFPRTLT
jgi:hypothetical protein